MSNRLIIEKLHVEQMYGRRMAGLNAEELSPELNVIYGENAAGKTTFGLATRGVIWEEILKEHRPRIVARFRIGDDNWQIEDFEGRRVILKNGLEDVSSRFIPSSMPEPYWLPLRDLLHEDGKSFAETIRKEADGRYNIRKAAKEHGFSRVRKRIGKTTDEYLVAREAEDKIRDDQSALHQDERRLSELERELEKARAARYELQLLQKVIQYKRGAAELARAQEEFSRFAPQLENVQQDDFSRLQSRLKEIEDTKERRDKRREEIEANRERLEANAIHRSGQEPVSVEILEMRSREIDKVEDDLRTVDKQILDLTTESTELWNLIGDDRAGINKEITREVAERIQKTFIDRLRLHAKHQVSSELRKIYEDLDRDTLLSESRQVEQDITRLSDWLADFNASEKSASSANTSLLGAVISVVAALIAGIVLQNIPAVLVAVLSTILFGAVWFLLRRSTKNRHVPALSEGRTIDEPLFENARRVLSELIDRRADVAASIRRAEFRNFDIAGSEIDELEAAVQSEVDALKREFGINPTDNLPTFSDHLLNFQRKRINLAQAEARRAVLLQDLEESNARFAELLEPFGIEFTGGHRAAEELISRYRTIYEDYRKAAGNQPTLEGLLNDDEKTILRLEDEKTEILSRINIPEENALSIVEELVAQRSAYQDTQNELVGLESQERALLAELKQHDLFQEDFLLLNDLELESRVDSLRRLADQEEYLRDAISGTNALLDKERRGHRLTDAMARRERAEEELHRELQQTIASELGDLLATHLEKQTRLKQLPPVYTRANELLETFTNQRFSLEFDTENNQFRARDNHLERVLELDALSAGTRVQLQLAVRIAFVEMQENDVRLPLLLDEALANSDDSRAEAIISAILELCKQGRQIFYFTAQSDEVAKMRRVAQDNPDIYTRFVSLPQHEPTLDLENVIPSIVHARAPEPIDGQSRQEYGILLNVPRWTLWEEVSALHLWYLEPDLPRLYQLLNRGFDHWGSLRLLYEKDALATFGYDERSILPLVVKADALENWRENWLIGRGRRVDRQVLEQSGAITDTFLDRVHDICRRVNGDAKALIHELETSPPKRFRPNSREALDEYLRAEGYIDDAKPLSQVEIRTLVIAHVSANLENAGLDVADLDDFIRDVQHGPREPQ